MAARQRTLTAVGTRERERKALFFWQRRRSIGSICTQSRRGWQASKPCASRVGRGLPQREKVPSSGALSPISMARRRPEATSRPSNGPSVRPCPGLPLGGPADTAVVLPHFTPPPPITAVLTLLRRCCSTPLPAPLTAPAVTTRSRRHELRRKAHQAAHATAFGTCPPERLLRRLAHKRLFHPRAFHAPRGWIRLIKLYEFAKPGSNGLIRIVPGYLRAIRHLQEELPETGNEKLRWFEAFNVVHDSRPRQGMCVVYFSGCRRSS